MVGPGPRTSRSAWVSRGLFVEECGTKIEGPVSVIHKESLMHRTTILAACILTAAPAIAQSILPKSAATKSPGYWSSFFFYGTTNGTNEGHTQTLYAESEVGGVKVFKSLQIRRPQNLGNQNAAMTGDMVLSLSSTAIAHTAASTTFAANHGATRATVFTGKINLPARNRGGTWPDPWETAVPFSNTFLFVPITGGSLVVENAFSNNSNKRAWYVEGNRAQKGTRATNLSACAKHSDGGRNNSIGYRSPVVGGSWHVSYNNMPSNVPSLAASFQILGIGGSGATQWGMPLPIPLSTLNMPSNGCSLAVTDDFRFPMTYRASTSGPNRGSLLGQTIPIPNSPAFAGASFFDQGVCLDTNATTKQPEIYMTWSSKWTVGSGKGEPVTTVYRLGDNSQPTGYLRQWEGPTVRLNL